MHLLGQSWGAFLAIEYALHFGKHLRTLTLASGAASTRECVAGMDSWRRELPLETQETLARHEANRDYSHPDYLEAMDTLYRRNFLPRLAVARAPQAGIRAHGHAYLHHNVGTKRVHLHRDPAGLGPHRPAG
jgi:pimeloyl-ACP methyl ester carboxylesterase